MSWQGENYLLQSAKCPYYKSEYKRMITCEGWCTRFPSEEVKQIFADNNCRRYPNECKITKILDEKWSGE